MKARDPLTFGGDTKSMLHRSKHERVKEADLMHLSVSVQGSVRETLAGRETVRIRVCNGLITIARCVLLGHPRGQRHNANPFQEHILNVI